MAAIIWFWMVRLPAYRSAFFSSFMDFIFGRYNSNANWMPLNAWWIFIVYLIYTPCDTFWSLFLNDGWIFLFPNFLNFQQTHHDGCTVTRVYLSVTLQNTLRTRMCYTFCFYPPKKWDWVFQEPKPPLCSLFYHTVYLSIYLSRLNGFPGFQLKANTMQKKNKKLIERIALNSSQRGRNHGTVTPEAFLCLLSMFNVFKAKVCFAQFISYQQSFSSWVWQSRPWLAVSPHSIGR